MGCRGGTSPLSRLLIPGMGGGCSARPAQSRHPTGLSFLARRGPPRPVKTARAKHRKTTECVGAICSLDISATRQVAVNGWAQHHLVNLRSPRTGCLTSSWTRTAIPRSGHQPFDRNVPGRRRSASRIRPSHRAHVWETGCRALPARLRSLSANCSAPRLGPQRTGLGYFVIHGSRMTHGQFQQPIHGSALAPPTQAKWRTRERRTTDPAHTSAAASDPPSLLGRGPKHVAHRLPPMRKFPPRRAIRRPRRPLMSQGAAPLTSRGQSAYSQNTS